MIHTIKEISEKYEQRTINETIEFQEYHQKVDSHFFDCSLHASMFYLFKMPKVESFIRNKLCEYVRKETKVDKYGYTHFFIDIDKLEEYCRGNAPYKLWKFKEDVKTQIEKDNERVEYGFDHTDTPTGSSDICSPYDSPCIDQEDELNPSVESENSELLVDFRCWDVYSDKKMEDGLTYGQIKDTDAWEQIEIIVLSDEMAVFVSTWNFITEDYRFDKPHSEDEIDCYKSKVWEKEEQQVYRLNNFLPVKVSMIPEGECLKYNNSLSMLFDVIINEALENKENKEITFIYPSTELSFAKTNYQFKGWEINDDFCNSNEVTCFKLVVFDSCYEIAEQTKRDTILKNIESFFVAGNTISKENQQYEINDACYAWSIPKGQAIAFFDNKRHGDYENYKLSFLHAMYSKTECTLQGMKAVSDLKEGEYKPNLLEEESSMDFLRKLKILENDTNQDVSIISENSIEPLWLKKTNTLTTIENLEKITTFLTKREEVYKGKTDQKILCFLDILSMVAIISYVLDSWEMIIKKPDGRGILVLVITLIVLVFGVFVFIRLFFNKGVIQLIKLKIKSRKQKKKRSR